MCYLLTQEKESERSPSVGVFFVNVSIPKPSPLSTPLAFILLKSFRVGWSGGGPAQLSRVCMGAVGTRPDEPTAPRKVN